MARPFVIISTAMSVDGRIDDVEPRRLILSNDEDWDQVDALRASCDAILVGAGALRADNPRLLVRSEARRRERMAAGRSDQPLKVTLTRSGRIDPGADFFRLGDCEKLIYGPRGTTERVAAELRRAATIVESSGDEVDPRELLSDLQARGVKRLLVEGGEATNTWFLSSGLVDELRLAVAPFFVGQAEAPRFVGAATFPHDVRRPMRLRSIERLGDVAVLWYELERRP